MKNKLLQQIILNEYIRDIVIVSILLIYPIYDYGFEPIAIVFSAIAGMRIVGHCIGELYTGLKHFLKIKKWELSRKMTIVYSSLILIILLSCVLFLPIVVIKWSFSSLAVLLFILFIIDISLDKF